MSSNTANVEMPDSPSPLHINWRILRDTLTSFPLEPSSTPTIFDHTPADLVPPLTLAHTCGLTSGIYTTPTLPTMIPYEVAQDCQWKYFQQGLQFGLQQKLKSVSQNDKPSSATPKSRPPDPFDGTRDKYSTFTLQLSLLFQNDPIRYHSEGVKIRTAASFLTGGALSWFKAYHDEETQEIRFQTYADFVKALKAAYDDPDRRATAEHKLLTLRQNNKDCSTYHAEFSTYANILEYDDRTRISFFRAGANNELQAALAHQLNPPEDFNEYVAMCIQLDNNIRNLCNVRTRPYYNPRGAPPGPVGTSSGTAPGPMDLSKATGPARSTGRRENNLCLYCRLAGHWAANCPFKKEAHLHSAVVSEPPVPASAPVASPLYANPENSASL